MSQQPELRKSILIIKAQSKSLMAVETFLRNREWRIHAVTDLKQALQTLVSQKPSFVMISVDHPNKKVKALPKLLSQAFPVYVIVFTESSTTSSYKALMDSGCNYRINPPATGPAVERTINKILRDRELEEERKRLAEQAAANPREGGGPAPTSGEGESNVLSGGESRENPSSYISIQGARAPEGGFNLQSATDLLKQMSDTRDDDTDTNAILSALQQGASLNGSAMAGGGPQGEGFAVDPGSPAGLRAGAMGGAGTLGSPGGAIAAEAGAAPLMAGSFEEPGMASEGGLNRSGLRAKNSGPSWVPAEGGGSQSSSASAEPLISDPILEKKPSQGIDVPDIFPPPQFTKEPPKIRYDEDEGSASPMAPPIVGEVARRRNSGQPGAENAGEPAELRARGSSSETHETLHREVHRIGGEKIPFSESESIFLRGTQKALDESVEIRDGKVETKLEGSSNIACLIIESPKFSGYLVAALGKNRRIDQNFMNTIRERLTRFLKDAGEPIRDDEPMNLKIRAVDFEGWALECAQFLRKSVHQGEEIAMAFFPFQEANTKVENSAQADMGAVKLDELTADVQVDFNVYVYLPANNKYVLYTPRGSKFYGSQKQRLEKMGVTHMHIKRTELQDVSRYRAQNYLNAKVTEYEQKKKKPSEAG